MRTFSLLGGAGAGAVVCVLGWLGVGSGAAALPAAARGPGAVYQTVTTFCETLDRGDLDALRSRIAGPSRGLRFTRGAGGRIEDEPVEDPLLCDLTPEGRPFAATDAKGLLAQLGSGFSTQVRSVRADCSSADCGWAAIELDRTRGSGDAAKVTPLRATALLRYVGDGWRVFHWQVSAR